MLGWLGPLAELKERSRTQLSPLLNRARKLRLEIVRKVPELEETAEEKNIASNLVDGDKNGTWESIGWYASYFTGIARRIQQESRLRINVKSKI